MIRVLGFAWLAFAGISSPRAVALEPSLAAPSRLRALDSAQRVAIDGVRNFRFRDAFGGEMRARLQAGSVTVIDWPLRAGAANEVTFRLMDVYAPDARIYRIDSAQNGLSEVPRSTWTFAKGVGKEGGTAWMAIDDGGRVQGATSSSDAGDLEIVETPPGTGDFVIQKVKEGSGSRRWSCAQNGESTGIGWRPEARSGLPLPGGLEAAQVLSAPHRATIAIDTDNEFMADRSDNVTTATNFIASLISQVSVIYQRDVNVQLLQGTTFLRVSTLADPFHVNTSPTSTVHLDEFTNYWSAGCAGTCTLARPGAGTSALATLLSGKSTFGASGTAWINSLCSMTNGYSVFQVFSGNNSTAAAFETFVAAHEFGHNFGSPHTHCYSNPRPDICFGGETSFPPFTTNCYSGATSCPASATYQGVTTRGTIMSYCHSSPLSCTDNYVFHTETMLRYFNASTADAAAVPNQCLFPAYSIASLTPNNGPTAGGTSVSIKGLALTGTHSVTFGGTPATSVAVLNDTTVTAVSPAHATGAVSVVLGNGSANATLTNAFFYANTSAASAFFSLTPCRIVDTRGFGAPIQGGSLAANSQRTWTLTNVCGVPASAKAVSANVTITGSSAVGQLSFYPGNAFPLGTSTLNYGAGQTRANNAMLELATDGLGSVGVLNSSAGSVHVILDVNGYFQ